MPKVRRAGKSCFIKKLLAESLLEAFVQEACIYHNIKTPRDFNKPIIIEIRTVKINLKRGQ